MQNTTLISPYFQSWVCRLCQAEHLPYSFVQETVPRTSLHAYELYAVADAVGEFCDVFQYEILHMEEKELG